MLYLEQHVRTKSGLKQLGLLGETHLYTPDESKFARSIVPHYDAVATEGGNRLNLGSLALAVVLAPYYSFIDKGPRSFDNPTCGSFAYDCDKPLFRLEDAPAISNWNGIREAASLMRGWSSFFTRHGRNTLREQYANLEQKQQEKLASAEYLGAPGTPVQHLWNPAGSQTVEKDVVDRRDASMAEAIGDLIDGEAFEAVLAVVGHAHLPGIHRLLQQRYDLQERVRETVYLSVRPGEQIKRKESPAATFAAAQTA